MSRDQKQPYVRFFASDWLGGTRGMKASEIGIYITLIALMYERCDPISNSAARLARQCGTSGGAFNRALKMLIEEGKIEVTADGDLWNRRVAKEFKWREVKSENAKAAVAERERKRQGDVAQKSNMENASMNDKTRSYIGNQVPHSELKINENNGTSEQTIIRRSSDDHPNQKPEARSHKEEEEGKRKSLQQQQQGHTPDQKDAGADGERDPLLDVALEAGNGNAAAQGWLDPFLTMTLSRWRGLGLSDAEIAAVLRAVSGKSRQRQINSPDFFNGPMQEAAGRKNSGGLDPIAPVNGGAGSGRYASGSAEAMVANIAARLATRSGGAA